ncbi:hypothetical protein Sulac_1191 [Sulfobacillus acidophilus DSM 10332]|uniref:Uncharacterized protein n=1 Tax=Sulfobacillus acidophilus (strain ATCC 700253 / DSM 10332 / NAL) TaxID=679936 RepID=G8TUP4_SULAD|nr:hypothetical protein Sulac_1191 [Sulfobacillus acidophilus DSM 10332]
MPPRTLKKSPHDILRHAVEDHCANASTTKRNGIPVCFVYEDQPCRILTGQACPWWTQAVWPALPDAVRQAVPQHPETMSVS